MSMTTCPALFHSAHHQWVFWLRRGAFLVLPFMLLWLSSCRTQETPAPQNVIQYQLGGWVRGQLNGRSLDRALAGDTFRLEAFLTRSQAVVYRDTMSTYTVRDTGTGPYLERFFTRYWRFSLYRFDPASGSNLTFAFPLWRATEDTVASFLGFTIQQDLRQTLSDSAFLQLEATVSNLPLPGHVQDPAASITAIRWDSAAGTISGQYQYRVFLRRASSGPYTDTTFVTGDFSMPVTRAIR